MPIGDLRVVSKFIGDAFICQAGKGRDRNKSCMKDDLQKASFTYILSYSEEDMNYVNKLYTIY
jgi:hypothetical protein